MDFSKDDELEKEEKCNESGYVDEEDDEDKIKELGNQLLRTSLRSFRMMVTDDWAQSLTIEEDDDDEEEEEEEEEENESNVVEDTIVKHSDGIAFQVTDAEVSLMLEELSHSHDEETKYLSRLWVANVMSQPYSKNKKERRPFEYSKQKLSAYLAWRKESRITSEISHCLTISSEDFNAKHPSFLDGGFYWYGVDHESCPVLWLHMEMTDFKNAKTDRNMIMSAVVIQSVLDSMPPHISMFHVVVLSDKVSLRQAMRKPDLAPAFIKLFTEMCPDRLKSAVMVTGVAGHYFYKMVRMFGPKSLMQKVTETKSRSKAGEFLVEKGIICGMEDIPTFLGGSAVHPYKGNCNFPDMIHKIHTEMKNEKKVLQ